MSEVTVGGVNLADGRSVEVLRDDDGTVTLWEPQILRSIILNPGELAQLRELLDRAAMPGQACCRPCCDHCNNREGDQDGHDYTLNGPHDGPCEECAAEQARREHDAD